MHTYIQCEWHRMTRMDRAGLRGYVQFNKYTYIHTYIHIYKDDRAGLRGYVHFNKYTSIHMCNSINIHTYIQQVSLIPPWEDQCEWHRMTRMTGPDCAVMCNLINIHTYMHTYMHTCVCVCFLPIHSGHQVRWTYHPGSHRRKVTQDFSSTFFLQCVP